MRVVVGLGNPGKKYEHTRHNIGFKIVDSYTLLFKSLFKPGKGDYYFTEMNDHNERILIVKPTTYMNNSGLAVKHVMKYYPVNVEDLLVVYDDYHLPFGTLRLREKGSDGGHNGVKSIIYHLETDKIARLRFGIGNGIKDTVSYVLSPFEKEEYQNIDDLISKAVEGIRTWIIDGMDTAMNKFNKTFI